MIPNVRFTICDFETDATFGVQTLVAGVENLEGYLEEVNDRAIGLMNGPNVGQKMPAQFKLLYQPRTVYLEADNTFTDLFEGLRTGAAIKFTHYRHPKLRAWMAYGTIDKLYLVSGLRDAEHFGGYRVATLKEHEN